ncbi:substrate-binding domain-containing protein [Rhodobacteraceae bacterium DSL-40]|uniref:substrate-binding domain-containing protein n=1 Tax=Amaricoccus sp. B4 TaxID=3368557 RepID=UPI000DAF24C9
MNLRELANLLDLSTTTVSRALNGYPEVSAATRERVAEAARLHGYAPNQVARRLATGRTLAIGHVIPIAEHQMINPVFADFLAGAGETYSAAGYDTVLSIVPAEQEAEAYREMARQRKVDGILVSGPKVVDFRIELLAELGLPFLVHGRTGPDEAGYSWIDINNRRAFRRATELLAHLGHRRIALLNGQEQLSFAARRRLGYEEALIEAGIAFDTDLAHQSEMTEPLGYAAATRMMQLADPPTAFLTSSIITAHGVLRAMRELGRQAGRDFSITTHDDDLSFLPNAGEVPLFTATRSSVRAAGRQAARMLIDLISTPESGPRQELWEVELTLGLSTGPAPRGQTHA